MKYVVRLDNVTVSDLHFLKEDADLTYRIDGEYSTKILLTLPDQQEVMIYITHTAAVPPIMYILTKEETPK